MSPPEGHAQGPGAPGPWREPRAGQWRTDASPGSRRRGPQTSPSAAAACACAVRLSGRMVPVSGTWRVCERIRVDPGFRRRGPVCHRCQRLSPLCPVALGDAVHLLWVVLERVSALCDVAKGSRVLPAERCLPCRRREPWPPPPCVREQVLQVAVEQHAVCCCCRGSAPPRPALRPTLPLPLPGPRRWSSPSPGREGSRRREAPVSGPCPLDLRRGAAPALSIWRPGEVQAGTGAACPWPQAAIRPGRFLVRECPSAPDIPRARWSHLPRCARSGLLAAAAWHGQD